jgi:putative ABC transport system substrate-binding protein
LSRRRVLGSLGGAIVAPSGAFAQAFSMPVIGVLDSAASSPAELADFYAGLQLEGYIRNKTLTVEYRSASGDYSRLPALAAGLVKNRVMAMTAIGLPAAAAAKTATTAIPIIFAVAPDPVRSGLVNSLDAPGGNMTGVTDSTTGHVRKRLDLMHELIPAASEVAVLVNPLNPRADAQSEAAVAAARAMGTQLRLMRAKADEDFSSIFDVLTAMQPRGLVIADDERFDSRGVELGFLALHYRIPAIFEGRTFAAAGGLIGYGSSLIETYHQAGVYTGMVLKGAKPAGLPIYQSTRIEFIINERTADALGISVSPGMLSAANEVIK